LAKLLLDLQPKWGWALAIAHCNHGWRADATGNARFVEEQAQTWQVPFSVVTASTPPSSEAVAREWRYQSLIELAQQGHAHAIVTGHTASDRAETLLYNLIRGSGADGLQALTWHRLLTPELELVRPLLDITRPQTAQFCQEMHLPVWHDSTNQDLNYARNRIRLELIPYLQHHLNPQAEANLAQTAELLQADVEYLETEATRVRLQATPTDGTCPGLNRRILQEFPLALQRRVIRQILQAHLPSAPNFEHIEKFVALIQAPNRCQSDPFPGGAIARVNGDWIQLISPAPAEE
jgi:tRNA(Ile)-lysidine synthase